jgi:CRP-like cAMP-binding protein
MDVTVIDATEMDATEIVAFVRTVPIFHTLSKDQLRQIAEAADVRTCDRGDVLAEPTSQDNELFIVVEGEFRVCLQQNEAEFKQELARLSPGDYFGVVPVVTGQHAPVVIESLESGRVIALSEQTIGKLFEGSPGFARAMWRSLGSHVAQSIDRIGVVFFAELDSFPNLSSTCRLLDPQDFFSFPRYCRFLLKAGLVAPERVERILPKKAMSFAE